MEGEIAQTAGALPSPQSMWWLKVGLTVAVFAVVTISLLDLYCIVDLDQLC